MKMALLGKNLLKFLNFYYIKSTFFGKKQEANGLCQVIFYQKRANFGFMKLWVALGSKFKNDASTSVNRKK
jgi:hypothetical protein